MNLIPRLTFKFQILLLLISILQIPHSLPDFSYNRHAPAVAIHDFSGRQRFTSFLFRLPILPRILRAVDRRAAPTPRTASFRRRVAEPDRTGAPVPRKSGPPPLRAILPAKIPVGAPRHLTRPHAAVAIPARGRLPLDRRVAPSTAFHLLYSKSGLQFEARLEELLRGGSTGDLGYLSPSQLARVDELQRETLKVEKEVTEAMAEQQETVADASMVELSQAMGELTRGGGQESLEERVDSALAPKEDALRDILSRADDLRMATLRSVIDVLTPIQAVHFLIAATELHIWIHKWGKKRDAGGPTQNGGPDSLRVVL